MDTKAVFVFEILKYTFKKVPMDKPIPMIEATIVNTNHFAFFTKPSQDKLSASFSDLSNFLISNKIYYINTLKCILG